MNRTRLTIYDFGKKIMSNVNNFKFYPISIIPKYYDNKSSDVYSLSFSWEWEGYNGFGTIDYHFKTSELCNEVGENFSQMFVHTCSRRQAQKNVSELYNDQSLVPLFNMILSKTDLNSFNLLKGK